MKHFLNVVDHRFEAYCGVSKMPSLVRDLLAGLIISLISIPFGVGFAIASGLKPEQGIVASILASILGGLFGGARYQVYGPTAAFITVIAGIVSNFDVPFLILASLIAGVVVVSMGIFGFGRLFSYIPHSIIVGFTMGIAATILLSQLPDLMGGSYKPGLHFHEKLAHLPDLFTEANGHAMVLGLLTFLLIKELYKISIYIPAPLIAILLCTIISNEIWHDKFIPLISTKFGHLNFSLFQISLPSLGQHAWWDLGLPVLSITFIAALESLLSAKMADRLAGNKTPFHADKELFGQGLVNIIVPLFNGFPCTGALARTATSIKVGAMSPLTSIISGITIVVLMLFFAPSLSSIPMASIAGLLFFVGLNMVKPAEVKGIFAEGFFSVLLMFYTAIMTLLTDLFLSVGTATVIYIIVSFFQKKRPALAPLPVEVNAEEAYIQGSWGK